MVDLRNLAEDLVYHITGKLYDDIDPVWEHEDEYVQCVLEVEDMLNDKLANDSQD